jgi:hypothetical protein
MESPPPVRAVGALTFEEWARAIVVRVREKIPAALATRRGKRAVILRCKERSATLTDDGRTFWIRFADARGDSTTMATLFDADRKDAFTASNLAASVTSYLD